MVPSSVPERAVGVARTWDPAPAGYSYCGCHAGHRGQQRRWHS